MEQNPTQLNGFAFLEFSGPDKDFLHHQFTQLGFIATAQYTGRDITLYQQGNIKFILNNEKDTQASQHALTHGAGACAMGFKVKNASQAYDYVLSNGATAFSDSYQTSKFAIHAIGGSVAHA